MSSNAERIPSWWIALGVAWVALFVGAIVTARGSNAGPLPGIPYFFETAEISSGGTVPIVPRGRISESESRARTMYGVAIYDLKGRLASYEAFKSGRRAWKSTLAYATSGVLETETYYGPGGSVVLWAYDHDGRFIDSKMIKGPDESPERIPAPADGGGQRAGRYPSLEGRLRRHDERGVGFRNCHSYTS